MRCIDLTHPLHTDSPVYPGTEPPRFDRVSDLEKDGHVETRIQMHTHTGTHLDAPAHMLAGGKTLDQYPVDAFYGPAILVDATEVDGPEIGLKLLRSHETTLDEVDFLLLRTGWDRHWGTDAYFGGFPALAREAAEWLAERNMKGIGVDAISIDRMESTTYPVHHSLLGADVLVLENLTLLDRIRAPRFHLACFPLPIRHADGSPVRAAAIEGCDEREFE